MSRKALYPIAQQMRQMCAMLGLSEDRVLQRAGLPSNYVVIEKNGVDAEMFFGVWKAIAEECGRPDAPITCARMAASRPCNSAMIAFTSSANVIEGLQRLALFKPLAAPIKLAIKPVPDGVSLVFGASEATAKMPESLELFDLVFFVEIMRAYTGEKIVPVAVSGPNVKSLHTQLTAYFGRAPKISTKNELVLRNEDVALPLISANAALLNDFIPTLQRRLEENKPRLTTTERVEATLQDILPSGKASADDVCTRLHISKRSLQRRLHEEGQTYRSVLDATRMTMAKTMLAQNDVSIAEISYLLAYRDPNSFYRAFHSWTGMTPRQARETL